MAVLLKDGLKLELTNIASIYQEEDESSGSGTYESFSFHVSVLEEEVLSEVIERDFELPSGNLLSLINAIGESLIKNTYQEVTFVEPDFAFELTPLGNKDSFRFCWWINSGAWEGVYSSTHMGFRMDLTRVELESFLEQLHEDWFTRKKLPLE